MKQTLCKICNHLINNCNYKKHTSRCDGIYRRFKKRINCKYCNLDFSNLSTSQRANHTRWCKQNPKENKYTRRKTIVSEKTKEKLRNVVLDAHKRGVYSDAQQKMRENPSFKGQHHTEEVKKIIQKKALESKHRRLRKYTILYKGILMDSGWEVELAKRLDSLNIKWIRPEPIPWRDKNNIVRNYFPDFYLPDYDIYIDPKNPIAYKSQIEKIKALHEQYNNIIILTNLKLIQEFDISSYNGTVS